MRMPVYVRGVGKPGDWKAAGEWKAKMCNTLQVDFFCEDDPKQIAILKEQCPNLTICEVVTDS